LISDKPNNFDIVSLDFDSFQLLRSNFDFTYAFTRAANTSIEILLIFGTTSNYLYLAQEKLIEGALKCLEPIMEYFVECWPRIGSAI